jgi:hypothetical protein
MQTTFDPSLVFRLVVVGEDTFVDRADLACTHKEVIGRLHDFLVPMGLFCSVVMQASEPDPILLAVNHYPIISQFPALSARVSESIGNFVVVYPR